MSTEETLIFALFAAGVGFLTAVPIALPAALLWSLVLPGTFEHMPSVLAGFATWGVIYFIVVIWVEGKIRKEGGRR
jgi:hypothetical protein